MNRLDSIFVSKHPLDSEQAAPFYVPTPDEVAAVRAGIEAVKQRNREASPNPSLLSTHEPAEL